MWNDYFATFGNTGTDLQPDQPLGNWSDYFNDLGGIKKQTQTSNWDSFSQSARKISAQRGFPAGVLLGQAALESARGSAAPGNNYFGIKGSGTAGSNSLSTQEFGSQGYYPTQSDFAAYQSPEDSINAYLDLVGGYPGVKEAVQSGDPMQVLQAIKNAGYATSPTYVQDVANTPEFQQNAARQ